MPPSCQQTSQAISNNIGGSLDGCGGGGGGGCGFSGVLGLNADAIALIDELGGAEAAACGVAEGEAPKGGVCGTGLAGVFFPGPGADLRGRSTMIGTGGAGGAFAPCPAPFIVALPLSLNFFPRFDTGAL